MADPHASARSEVLGRIRAAIGPDRPRVRIPRDYDARREHRDVVELLARRVAGYRAVVRRVASADLPDAVGTLLTRRRVRIMLGPTDLPEEWRVPDVEWHLDDPPLTVEQLDRADGVLTGCAVAIAETGTVVLDAGATQGRRALTLVPDYHLCVVRADQVVGTVPEALARLDPVRPLTFVSGPSATSDIELDRVEGVHGPRALEVLIVS
ncbi:LutC/YkgG family protein [Streptoalloteichus hindustanus]|uniref:L-lactate dehydrogenase complex protein LldG n=1 Tax=Streptoalloteichus hindustanus TaxID=2017 RepID=A0A1M4VAM0_STRHI|nr:lactate utilization protein C [Streptoalloteichus hindustanus]SHE66045.1 L-lactate dehydrogenase complex protein LldG [Streptoalloteichus hindustanus]